ncbi:MAG: hypothetical protein H0W64_01270 [Gammaproteobacteria bacterium]|nr:hypothetical protein [Gammaproteobacteria bacterium]
MPNSKSNLQNFQNALASDPFDNDTVRKIIVDVVLEEQQLLRKKNSADTTHAKALRKGLVDLIFVNQKIEPIFLLAQLSIKSLPIAFDEQNLKGNALLTQKIKKIAHSLSADISELQTNATEALTQFKTKYNDNSSTIMDRKQQISHIIDVLVATELTTRYIADPDANKKPYEQFTQYMEKHGAEPCRKIGYKLKAIGFGLGALVLVGAVVTLGIATFGVAPLVLLGVGAGLAALGVVASASGSAGKFFEHKANLKESSDVADPMKSILKSK